MTFSEQLWLTVIDNAILAIGILLVGYFINRRLERDKANEGIRQKTAEARAAAYLSLWQLTAEIDAIDRSPLTPGRVEQLLNEITEWYYEKGNGLYLSHPATQLFLEARKTLKKPSPDVTAIKKGFSRFRTQMKQDIGIYTERQARRPVN